MDKNLVKIGDIVEWRTFQSLYKWFTVIVYDEEIKTETLRLFYSGQAKILNRPINFF